MLVTAPLKAELAEDADGAAQADGGILRAVFHDHLFPASLKLEKGAGEENADQRENHEVAQGQEDAGVGSLVRHVLLLFTQRAGKQGIDAHGGAAAKGDHQVLKRKCEGHGIQGILTELGHENAVHNVVQRLHQHGDHHGNGHACQQPADRQNAHLVLLYSCACGVFCTHKFL